MWSSIGREWWGFWGGMFPCPPARGLREALQAPPVGSGAKPQQPGDSERFIGLGWCQFCWYYIYFSEIFVRIRAIEDAHNQIFVGNRTPWPLRDRRLCIVAGKVTMDGTSHRPCITDCGISMYQLSGLRQGDEQLCLYMQSVVSCLQYVVTAFYQLTIKTGLQLIL